MRAITVFPWVRHRRHDIARHQKMPELGRISRICLECAAIFGHLPLTVRCRFREYTRTIMIKRLLTICAAVAASSAVTSVAVAQGYPRPPGPVYSTSPAPYPPGGYAVDERRAPGAPDFDALDDDDMPNAQSSTALPLPGPVLSPDDPRYGRPMGPPVYSDRGPPPPYYDRGAPPVYSDRGPVLSPDDPRYGRPAGPPPVIYSDRPATPQQTAYSGRDDAPRPPGGIGGPTGITGSVTPAQGQPQGADGKPLVLSALPPEEQPEVGPAQLAPNLRRQEVAFPTKEPAGTLIVDTPNTYLYYVLGGGHAVRYGVRVGRDGFTSWTGVQKISLQGRVAGLASADRDDRAPALSAARSPGGRPRQSAWRPRNVSWLHRLSDPRHQSAFDDRQVRLVGLHRHAERGRLRPVRSRQGRHPRGCHARWPAAGNSDCFRRAAARRPCRPSAATRGNVRSSRRGADSGAAAARARDGAVGSGTNINVAKKARYAGLF